MEDQIQFFIEDTNIILPDKQKIKEWLFNIADEERCKIREVNYIFCSDEYLLDINKRYLQHDYYTDIITFQYNEKESPIEGDCFISSETVRYNAQDYNDKFENELYRVIVHGLLHLLGYEDKKESDYELMKKKENYYLKR